MYQQELLAHLDGVDDDGPVVVRDLDRFFAELLHLTPELFDRGDALPDDLSAYVEEGKQTLRPSWALKKLKAPTSPDDEPDLTPDARAGRGYDALVWELPAHLPLDKPETVTRGVLFDPSQYPFLEGASGAIRRGTKARTARRCSSPPSTTTAARTRSCASRRRRRCGTSRARSTFG